MPKFCPICEMPFSGVSCLCNNDDGDIAASPEASDIDLEMCEKVNNILDRSYDNDQTESDLWNAIVFFIEKCFDFNIEKHSMGIYFLSKIITKIMEISNSPCIFDMMKLIIPPVLKTISWRYISGTLSSHFKS